MKIRGIEKEDYDKVAEIYQKYWEDKLEIPDTEGRIVELVVENEKKEIVTYAMMKLWAEVMMIMDSSKPLKQKSDALSLLIQAAVMSARKLNLSEFHLFTNNESYAKLLVKHFGFQDLAGLHVLRLKLEK